jgi:hypothetical protein
MGDVKWEQVLKVIGKTTWVRVWPILRAWHLDRAWLLRNNRTISDCTIEARAYWAEVQKTRKRKPTKPKVAEDNKDENESPVEEDDQESQLESNNEINSGSDSDRTPSPDPDACERRKQEIRDQLRGPQPEWCIPKPKTQDNQ